MILDSLSKKHFDTFADELYAYKDDTTVQHVKDTLLKMIQSTKNIVRLGRLTRTFISVCKNKLKAYHMLNTISPVSESLEIIINDMRRNYEVRCYDRKLELLSKVGNCPICLDEEITVIPKECCHYYCPDCYVLIDSCQVCQNDNK